MSVIIPVDRPAVAALRVERFQNIPPIVGIRSWAVPDRVNNPVSIIMPGCIIIIAYVIMENAKIEHFATKDSLAFEMLLLIHFLWISIV